MRIALDAMGGDAAPRATVEGAVAAARELGLGLLLVGDRARVEPELARHKLSGLDVEFRHATQTIAMDESPTAALRKADSSMSVGLTALREGDAAGFVFAGNTGAGMVLGAHLLGRCPGVERPAIAVLVPSPRGHTILLDAGANVDCRPIHLTQFAVMGDAYARAVRQIAAPRVGLLSNGLEDSKGNSLVRAAAPMLRQLPINFVGYVEGREVSSGSTDVVVCDGFVGNLVLKSLEGFGRLMGDRLRGMFEHSWRTKLAYLLLRREVATLRQELDARETGGALLLGLNGIAVKAHGSSDARAIRNAVAVAANLAQSGVMQQVASGIAATVGLDSATVEQQPRAKRFWSTIRDRLRRDGRGERVEPVSPLEAAPTPLPPVAPSPIVPPSAAAAPLPAAGAAAAVPPSSTAPSPVTAAPRSASSPAAAPPPQAPLPPVSSQATGRSSAASVSTVEPSSPTAAKPTPELQVTPSSNGPSPNGPRPGEGAPQTEVAPPSASESEKRDDSAVETSLEKAAEHAALAESIASAPSQQTPSAPARQK